MQKEGEVAFSEMDKLTTAGDFKVMDVENMYDLSEVREMGMDSSVWHAKQASKNGNRTRRSMQVPH